MLLTAHSNVLPVLCSKTDSDSVRRHPKQYGRIIRHAKLLCILP
jgi:hypothetical protein